MSLPIVRKDSSHYDQRKNGVSPTFLIIHFTESRDAGDPDGYFMATRQRPDGARVSAHYLIDVDGAITQYVDESARAWHAGLSEWGGVADINTHSIGIELVNGGPTYGYTDFADDQIDALAALSKQILGRHNIPAHHVLAHSDIAPGRKIDPDYKFPWRTLASAGVGVWPQPIQADFNEAAALLGDDARLKQALVRYGYNPALDLPVLVREFQRHFQPEAFTSTPPYAGRANDETALRLAALLRQKLAFTP
ncbi:MAG: N-acetylmuramoyl-L-alanine amidase [Micavibrio aeruginosavorus]|uniref:N-acetylmuramoyl-L-alanine amidase n=1 Tax=Micavibrio aeruginosavorus TaxID=349221 RepID=A0A7T5R1Z7_9BACT|nr:MAG: N-acetylmuramoyl-L-alanine amidase [Micavibrio aeruginosavorus]